MVPLLLLTVLTFAPTTALASTTPQVEYSTSTAEQIVRLAAKQYGVSGDQMWATTKCENPSLVPTQQSNYYQKGKREDSWGNSQINLFWNPEVTKKQAQDPFFAADFMAQAFSKGHQSRWTCWRSIFLQ